MIIRPIDRQEFPYYTDDSIIGIRRVRMIPTAVLLLLLNGGVNFEKLRRKLGWNTNPNWLTARIAEELYLRGEMDERELDGFTA